MKTDQNKAFEIAALISKQHRGTLTASEQEQLTQWRQASPANEALYTSLTQEKAEEELAFMADIDVAHAWQKVARATGQQTAKVVPLWQRFSVWRNVAAAVVILVSGLLFYKWQQGSGTDSVSGGVALTTAQVTETDRAMLILEDGSRIDLDSLQQGTVKELHGVKVIADGDMVKFDASAAAPLANAPVTYNTVVTPKGGQYHVILPDGSEVWLNATSSLRFPSAFAGTERRVELTGEGYFEVVKDKKQFIVGTGQVEVAVLGTSFNVSAYKEDAFIATTLLTGHVQLSGSELKGITNLLPGKQAIYSKAKKQVVVNKVDAEMYIAWMDGKLYFENATLATIFTKLDRWYDFETVYLDEASKHKTFTGIAFKDKPLDNLLQMISQTTDVSFEKKGEKLLVRKK